MASNTGHLDYDSNLAASVPVTKGQLQGGYDAAVLTEKPPTPSRQLSQPTDPEAGLLNNPGRSTSPTFGKPPKAQPWYRTTKGIIIAFIVFIVILAAAIGGGVGGSKKKSHPPVANVATGPAPTTTSIVGGPDSGPGVGTAPVGGSTTTTPGGGQPVGGSSVVSPPVPTTTPTDGSGAGAGNPGSGNTINPPPVTNPIETPTT